MAQAEEDFAGLRIQDNRHQHPHHHYHHYSSDTNGEYEECTPKHDVVTNINKDQPETFGKTTQNSKEECKLIEELHTDTPPISIPRQEENRFEEGELDVSYPNRPDDAHASAFNAFHSDRRPSISFNPEVRLDSGDLRALEEPLAKGDLRSVRPQRTHLSALRKLQPNYGFRNGPSSDLQSPRRIFMVGALDNDYAAAQDPDAGHPTSLTSNSTFSPSGDEIPTPSKTPKTMLSPFTVSPILQRTASYDDPSFWYSSAPSSFGNRSRSYTFERNGSFRQIARQGSRRSTGSSGKSPASNFLSMWSTQEEVAPQPDDEGQMVGTDYVLGKQIGFGGFSTVKEAFKVEPGVGTRHLAVKIVRKQVVGKSEQENDQVQAEFDHEVRIWRYLNHPHILSLDAVYETDYATFCFTKLAIGGTLFDLVRANRSGLEMGLVKKYAYQLASALRYLHEDARVIHRDIKLENCLLDPVKSEDGSDVSTLVLCDFGMAEWLSTDNGSDSDDSYDNPADRPPRQNIGPSGSSTSVAGSLEYASPELILSTGGMIDCCVDLWAYGVVVYAMVVGSRPFQDPFPPRTQANILKGEWSESAVLGTAPHLQDRRDALQLIKGCLEMDIGDRWTIRNVLECALLKEFSEFSEECATETTWRL